MKRFPWLLLILFFLTGCAPQEPPAAASEPVTGPVSLYDPGSQLEAATGGAVLCYPLYETPCSAILSVKDSLYLFATSEAATTVSKLDTETGTITAGVELPFVLGASDPSIHPLAGGFSCFDPHSRRTLVLSEELEVLREISLPGDMTGIPILSRSGSTLYYCTSGAIRSLELESGIHRVLKETLYLEQTIRGLILEDQVLVCTVSDGTEISTLFLCAHTGATLGVSNKVLDIHSSEEGFYAFLREGNAHPLVFGSGEGTLQTLLFPHISAEPYVLPQCHGAVTGQQSAPAVATLDYYDLHSGRLAATLTMYADTIPRSIAAQSSGNIWFVNFDLSYGCDTLYCWKPSLSPSADTRVYTEAYHSRQTPDENALEQSVQYARQLGAQYGIEILVYRDAAKFVPGEYEHLAPVLQWELEQLEKHLGNYPPGFLQTLAQRFDGLTICILREIGDTAAEESPEAANGAIFWQGLHPYIALPAGADTERGLYHALCHLIDTVVLSLSSAYDTWNEGNPTGFQYDYDYIANRSRNSTAYLLEHNRYFVDMFSMSFPKEDRARIMECAMMPGNQGLFQTDAMQKKLFTLCSGIREAFQLEKCTAPFLWEQYLHTPIAPEP